MVGAQPHRIRRPARLRPTRPANAGPDRARCLRRLPRDAHRSRSRTTRRKAPRARPDVPHQGHATRIRATLRSRSRGDTDVAASCEDHRGTVRTNPAGPDTVLMPLRTMSSSAGATTRSPRRCRRRSTVSRLNAAFRSLGSGRRAVGVNSAPRSLVAPKLPALLDHLLSRRPHPSLLRHVLVHAGRLSDRSGPRIVRLAAR